MALVKGVTEQRDIPHEPGEWMRFRLLSWEELEHARIQRSRSAMSDVRAMGGEIYRVLRDANEERPAPPVESNGHAPDDAKDDDADATLPRDMYDMGTMLRIGIVAWSYPDEVTPDTIGLLDKTTAEWALGVILGMHVMGGKEERKNGFTPFINS